MSAGRGEGRPGAGRRWARAAVPLYAWLAVPGLLGALPVGLMVGHLWGQRPGGGDRAVWEAGGFGLLETARLLGRDLGALAWASPWVLLGWALLGLVPQALALAWLRPGEAGAARWARALGAVSALATVLGGTLLVRGLLVAVGAGLMAAFGPAIAGLSDRGRDLTRLLLAGVMLGLLSLARLLHDVAAAAAVEQGRGGRDALWVGLEVLHRRLPGALWAWGWRATAGAAIVALAAAAGRGHAGWGLALAALGHQGALLGLAMLRASWLDWARRALPPGPDDGGAGHDAAGVHGEAGGAGPPGSAGPLSGASLQASRSLFRVWRQVIPWP